MTEVQFVMFSGLENKYNSSSQVLLSRVRYFSSGSLSNDINTVLDSYRTAAERVMCVLVPGSPYSTTDRTPGTSSQTKIQKEKCKSIEPTIYRFKPLNQKLSVPPQLTHKTKTT